MTDAVGGEEIDDAGKRTLEAEATPSAHPRGIDDSRVGAAGPFVVCKEEGAARLVNGAGAKVGARGLCDFWIA